MSFLWILDTVINGKPSNIFLPKRYILAQFLCQQTMVEQLHCPYTSHCSTSILSHSELVESQFKLILIDVVQPASNSIKLFLCVWCLYISVIFGFDRTILVMKANGRWKLWKFIQVSIYVIKFPLITMLPLTKVLCCSDSPLIFMDNDSLSCINMS